MTDDRMDGGMASAIDPQLITSAINRLESRRDEIEAKARRDGFAMAALAALSGMDLDAVDPAHMAVWVYAIADAMEIERNKK